MLRSSVGSKYATTIFSSGDPVNILSLDLQVFLNNLYDFPLHTDVYLRLKMCDPVKILSLDLFIFLRKFE